MKPKELRAYRIEDLGMSQRELADALGYKDSMSISRMERGLVTIKRATEIAILSIQPARKGKKNVTR